MRNERNASECSTPQAFGRIVWMSSCRNIQISLWLWRSLSLSAHHGHPESVLVYRGPICTGFFLSFSLIYGPYSVSCIGFHPFCTLKQNHRCCLRPRLWGRWNQWRIHAGISFSPLFCFTPVMSRSCVHFHTWFLCSFVFFFFFVSPV